MSDSSFHRFGNGTSQTAGRSRVLRQNLAADLCLHAWRRRDMCPVCTHDFASERLLLIRTFDHEYLTIEAEVCTCHAQCRAPLSCSCFGSHAFEPLFLGIISLRNGRIELVASGSVVAFELIVDFSRCAQCFFEEVCPDER